MLPFVVAAGCCGLINRCRSTTLVLQTASSALQVGGTHAGAEAAPLLGGPRVLADGEVATGTVGVKVFSGLSILNIYHCF